MKVFVKVKANAKENKIIPPSKQENLWQQSEVEEWYSVHVKAPPKEGKANDAVAKILSEHFQVPQNRIRLLRGATSKQKLFEVVE